VRRTLAETFPNVRVIVDAPVQMEREVAALRQRTGTASPRDLDAMLAALAAAVPPGRTPSALEFNGSELRATGLALGSDELRAVATRLKPLGYAGSGDATNLVITVEDAR
jgi:general secretion pathway protein L